MLTRTCIRYPKHRPTPPLFPHLVGVDCITILHLTLSLIDLLSNMSAEAPPKYIYKIVPSAPEDPFPKEHPLSELDRNDGFVHLSTSTQVSPLQELGITQLKQFRYPRQQTCFLPVQPHFGLSNWNLPSLLILSNGRTVSRTCTATLGLRMWTLLRSLFARRTKHGAKLWESQLGWSRFILYILD